MNAIDVQFAIIADGHHFGSVGGNCYVEQSIETPLVYYRAGQIPDDDLLVDTRGNETLPIWEPSTDSDDFVVFHCPYTVARLF